MLRPLCEIYRAAKFTVQNLDGSEARCAKPEWWQAQCAKPGGRQGLLCKIWRAARLTVQILNGGKVYCAKPGRQQGSLCKT